MTSFAGARGPLLYAHRGAQREHPENSLEACAAALAAGADALELDVHQSADGYVMVSHDPDGLRCAGEPRAIRSCTLAELKRWNIGAGAGLACPRGQSAQMPTLDEVLEAFPRALLNVDVKQSRPDMLPSLLATIARHAAHERVLLTSFSSRITRALRVRGYPGPIGLGQAEAVRAVFAPRLLLALFPLHGVRLQVPLSHGPFRLDRRALITKLHQIGLAVDYWVVNDLHEAERLLELGADGIVTDDPRAMAALFKRSPRAEGWRQRHP